MKIQSLQYPLLFFAIAFAVGIWLEKILNIQIGFILPFFILLVIWGVADKKRSSYILISIFLCAGALNFKTWDNRNLEHPIEVFFPIEHTNVISEIVDPPSLPKNNFIVKLKKIIYLEDTIRINRKFQVNFKDLPGVALPGDQLFLENVTLDILPLRRNPGQFDYASFLQMRGVMGLIITHPESIVRLESFRTSFNFRRHFYILRENISTRISSLIEEQPAKFLIAILLGKKEGLSPEVKEDFQNSGVAHVLAISGLHVGFIVLVIMILLSFLPISFRGQNILTILFLIFYVFLTGANPPVVRASLMVSLYLIGINLERRPDIYNTVFTSALVILLFQPQQLFWVGFQFSFIAVLSILYFYRSLRPFETYLIKNILRCEERSWIRNWLIVPFLVSVAAQLGTIPLMIIYFYKLPLISFLLNIIVIPIVGFIVPLGLLSIFTSFFSFHLAMIISKLLTYAIDFLIEIVHLSANLPFAYLHLPRLSSFILISYILALWLIFSWKKEELRQLRIPILIVIFLMVMLSVAPKKRNLQLIMFDVGQGEATLVRTTSGKQILFDAGPNTPYYDSGRDIIFPALQEMGKLHLEKVILSHSHADHIGGLFSLSTLISIDSVYLPLLRVNYYLQDSLVTFLKSRNISTRFLSFGEIIKVDKYSKIYILAPFRENTNPYSTAGFQINNTSIVSLLKIGDTSILFTGDAELPVERKLVNWGSILAADILKVGHHGSITSSSQTLLTLSAPNIGVIPVGRNNRFNHPSKEILLRLKNLGIKYYRTDKEGAVWCEYRQGNWQKVEWQ